MGLLLLALVLFAPLAIGTVHTWTKTTVFLGCALAFTLTLLERLSAKKRYPVTVPLVALALGVGFSALQLVPLPKPALAWLSPGAHDVFSMTLGDYGSHAISLDPSATLAEVAKLGAYAMFFAAVCVYASRTQRRRQVVLAVCGVATLVAIIGLVQAALHSKKILFFYVPHAEWGTLVRGTFVNPNHFGGLMVLVAPCLVALGLREGRLRWIAFPAAVLVNVAIVLSLARATILAAAVGQVMVFVLDRIQLARGSSRLGTRKGARATMVLLVVAALGIGISIGATRLRPEVARTQGELGNPYSKVNAWKRASVLVWKYPWVGVGRGAFEQGFTQVDDRGGHVRFPWIENAYIQSVTDWGVPLAVLLLLLASWSLVLAFRRLDEDPLAIGTLSGIAALAVHEAADFSVELPGVALPALALLATLFGRRTTQATEAGLRRVTTRWIYLVVPVLLGGAAIASLSFPSAEADAAALARVVRDPAVRLDDVIAHGEGVRDRHPADFYVHALVAERLARERHPGAMVWLNRAIFLNPTHSAPHLLAGELLGASGRKSQSLFEFRLAATVARDPRVVWATAARRYPGMDDLLEATPDTARHRILLGKWLLANGRQADAERAFLLVLEKDPQNVRALQWLAEAAIGRQDAKLALERTKALLEVDRGEGSLRIAVRAHILAKELEPAANILDAKLGRTSENLALHLRLAEAYSEAGDEAEARARLERVEKTWHLDRASRISVYETRAGIERRAGNEHQLRWNLEQAERLRNR